MATTPRPSWSASRRTCGFGFTRCGGGDVVDLLRRLGHHSYRECAEYLAAVAATSPSPSTPGSPSPRASPSGAATFRPYTRCLHLDPAAPLLRSKGIRSATARHFEAGAYDGPGFLAGCVAVRLHDPGGRPLGYAGRRLDPHEALRYGKWKMPPRLPKKQLLYGYHRVERFLSAGVVLVECPWGVMRLAQLRIAAVALLGTRLSEDQHRLLASAPRVIVMLDGDPAGREATKRIRRQLSPSADVRVAYLPRGLDPDDLSDDRLAACVRPLLLS